MKKTFYLIDAMAFIFRAFHAINANLTDASHRPTNAVYGFTRILLKILREQQPDYVAVVFDSREKNFRKEMYPAYKANRKATPEELIEQFPRVYEVVKALNLPALTVPGVEADDVMGTLAVEAEKAGMDVVLVSGDKDLLQLVSDQVKMFDPGKEDSKAWTGPAEVEARFGVGPEHVPEALALIGDSADNIPGVRNIGEKTAAKILSRYQTLENVYANLEEFKGKQREYLEADKEQAFFARTLVTIKKDVEVDGDLESYKRREWKETEVEACFRDLAFHSILEELVPTEAETETVTQSYALVLTREGLEQVVAELNRHDAFALDTETTSLQPMLARLAGISLSAEAGRAWYIPLGHEAADLDALMSEDAFPDPEFSAEEALELLKPLLEDPAIEKYGHNIKYDFIVLARAGIHLQGIGMDTMLASYLTDASRLRHNLDELSLLYLNHKTIPITDLIGKGAQSIPFSQVPLAKASDYACEDADITWRLAQRLRPELAKEDLIPLLDEIELPLVEVLAAMEMAGIAIDTAQFAALQQELATKLTTLESTIYDLAGEEFNINSPKQLQRILFDKLQLKPGRKIKSGYSTDLETLESLAKDHPLPESIVEYRGLEKLRSTYVDVLPNLVNPETGRIHTSFNQAVAATGRLSSSNPNLQNIPTRTELGRRIRRGFVADGPDKKLIAADYSQIELRILAHLAQDDALCEAFREDKDIHRDTASRIFRVAPDEVTSEMRRQAKAINFGVIYGMGEVSLAKSQGLTRQEAKQFIESYFNTYPGVTAWLEDTRKTAHETGYVLTLMNRKRLLPDIRSSSPMFRSAAERMAVNTPVQGSAADIIKIAMTRVHEALKKYPARLLLQVHDELVIEADATIADEVAQLTRDIMENAISLLVPLKVDVGVGDHWAEIH
ncbi:MAG: DNA polymerase I [Candidatus Hydrogenedens sp.]|nr:DNA polymerase I [Candidatus Hydrogenedens sp.]